MFRKYEKDNIHQGEDTRILDLIMLVIQDTIAKEVTKEFMAGK
jgi:hypothetical protein